MLREDDSPMSRPTTRDYLSSLSRLADDGRSLLKAPQRYSSRQWRANLASLASCNILRAVRGQLIWQAIWALVVSAVYILIRGVPTLPALPHSLLGGVLGVLLGFRTNQSYDRFWEGRKLWGQCFTACRCIARSSLAYIDSDLETYSKLMRYLKAFPVALKQHLRGEMDVDEFAGILDSRELNELLTADNLPLSVCTSLSMTLNAIKLDQTQTANNLLWWTLEDHVSNLVAIVSDCERLVRTPVPVAYAVHASRLLSLWVGTLPFVLVGCFTGYRRLLTMPLTALVAWALFCTEELGHIIEEPFGAAGAEADGRAEVLPLGRYCESLQNDLEESSLAKARALRAMESAQQSEADDVAVSSSSSGGSGGGYGPAPSESIEVTDEEALEIALEARATVDAVELEQEVREEQRQAREAEAADAAAREAAEQAVFIENSYLAGPEPENGSRMPSAAETGSQS